ncbi:MAG: hypothetical protein R6V57_10090 [Vicinamibacterales bacterium]
MWSFCIRSLFREYGGRFAAKVALRHPWRTLRAVRDAAGLVVTEGGLEVIGDPAAAQPGGPPSMVGVGFCLKPLNPPCPSGRANHDCLLLEKAAGVEAAVVPAPCRSCAIREIGTQSLRAGSAFYVMTSARDILDDVFVPSLEARRFRTGLFVLCRYSFQPFALGLLASGMNARLLPLDQGDCRDYRTWLLADRGIKDEQTTMDDAATSGVARLLGPGAPWHAVTVERRGNVLHSVAAGPLEREVIDSR